MCWSAISWLSDQPCLSDRPVGRVSLYGLVTCPSTMSKSLIRCWTFVYLSTTTRYISDTIIYSSLRPRDNHVIYTWRSIVIIMTKSVNKYDIFSVKSHVSDHQSWLDLEIIPKMKFQNVLKQLKPTWLTPKINLNRYFAPPEYNLHERYRWKFPKSCP